MTDVPLPLMLLGLPVWLAPAFLLLFTLCQERVVRVVSGVVLGAALTFFYLVVIGLVSGPGWPMWVEGLLFWAPTTLVVGGAAFVADWWRSRRSASATGTKPQPRPEGGPFLVAVFVVLSLCGAGCVLTPVGELVDVRFDSPTPGLVTPMPSGLRLVSTDSDCGSEACSYSYVIDSPDGAGYGEMTKRLWAHLEGNKGWERRKDDAGCQRPGWFVKAEYCVFVTVEPAGVATVLRLHVSGAVTVS